MRRLIVFVYCLIYRFSRPKILSERDFWGLVGDAWFDSQTVKLPTVLAALGESRFLEQNEAILRWDVQHLRFMEFTPAEFRRALGIPSTALKYMGPFTS